MTLSQAIQSNIRTSLSSARSVSTATGSYTSQSNISHDSANNVFTDLSAVGSVNSTYHLSGSLENSIGDSFTISEIFNLQLINHSETSAITAFGGSLDIPILSSAGSVVNIGAGSRFNYDDPRGLTVTNATADVITIRGTGARFEIMVIGADV